MNPKAAKKKFIKRKTALGLPLGETDTHTHQQETGRLYVKPLTLAGTKEPHLRGGKNWALTLSWKRRSNPQSHLGSNQRSLMDAPALSPSAVESA